MTESGQPAPMGRAAHARAVLVLGLPLVGGHLAQFAIGATDALMLGWYDVTALAAVTLAGSLFFVFLIMGAGFAWAVLPMVASASEGPDADRQIRRVTRMGLWLSMLFAAVAMPVMLLAEPILRAIGQTDTIARLGAEYLTIAGWGLFPGLLVMLLKAYLSALERTQVVLWVTVAAALANALLNYALIFGNFGAPELGIRGSAIASVVVHLLSAGLLVVYAIRVFPQHQLFVRLWRADWPAFATVFRLGWPIGLTNLAEVGLFSFSAVMVGWLGEVPLAAHGIALQIASATFMVHLGLSNAATIRAGKALGRRDAAHLRRGALVVTALSLGFALVTVVAFLVAPKLWLGLFLSPDEPLRADILALGTWLMVMAALFQTVDGLQALALGLLRGVQDTRVPMIHAGISYWAVGVPLGFAMGIGLGWGAVGIWGGLVLGLACAAVLLLRRFWGTILPRISADVSRRAVT